MPNIFFQLLLGCDGCLGLLFLGLTPALYKETCAKLARRGGYERFPALIITIGVQMVVVAGVLMAAALLLYETGEPHLISIEDVNRSFVISGPLLGLGFILFLIGWVLASRARRRYRSMPQRWVADYEI